MIMNEEQFKKHIKELARIEFENNIKNNLDSSIIFKYIQGLEQEIEQLKKQLEHYKAEEIERTNQDLLNNEMGCLESRIKANMVRW